MRILKATLIGLACGSAIAGSAQAGGFARGEADTDIIFEDGQFVARAGATYVSPNRGYETINGASVNDDDYTNNFWIPSIAAKVRLTNNLSCAFTYTQPYGGDVTYGAEAQAADRAADLASTTPLPNALKHSDFVSNEYGGTCAVNFTAGKGDLYIIGGAFAQSFEYTEVKDLGTLHLKDEAAFGWRLGAAYEIKEYALRAQVMYRSQVDQKAEGTSRTTSSPYLPFLGLDPNASYDAHGEGSLPQSLEVGLQSGIAPDWLAFGSVKWTDWSVVQTLDYTIEGGAFGDINSGKNFYWRDGWTITGGVGHKFNDQVSGALSLTWDRGVGTGADIQTDTWTVGAGADINAGPGVLRLAGAVSYMTSGSQTAKTDGTGADFNATVGGDWAYAVNASYKIAF